MSQTAQSNLTAEEVMRARHSVKKYERGHVIPEAELNEILELAGAAPSSWNLQHWRFLVVTDQANKDRLLPIAYNQQQVSDASAVVLVLGDLEANLTAPLVYDPAVEAGALSQQVRDTLVGQIDGAYANNPQNARDEANRNASLAAMQLMLAAKAKGYDTCPMGGFDRQKAVEALNVPDRFTPVMMIVIGRAAAPAHPSGRLPLDQIVIRESF